MRTDKKRFSTRLAAAVMAGTLAVGMMGMSVFAAGVQTGSPITSVTVTKNVWTDGNTMAPNTTFNFVVNEADAGKFNDGNKEQVVYEGVEGGLQADKGAVFSPGAKGSASQKYTETGTLKTNSNVFTRPGVYHYTVTEETNTYEGVTIDKTPYDVYVYVYNGSDNNLYVGNVVSAKNNQKTDLEFNNDYGKEKDTTHDVTIKKVITGNQAVLSDTFQLSVKVIGIEGEKYKVTLDGVEQDPITSGVGATYTVTNNTTIHIYGLTESDTVTVTEADNNDGYVATYSRVKNKDGEEYSQKTINGGVNVKADGSKAEVTNTKNVTTPTGIVLNYGPYILMIALAGSMAVFFFRRKNHKEA